jgi:hypothetical protein
MLRRVGLVRIDVSAKQVASIFRVGNPCARERVSQFYTGNICFGKLIYFRLYVRLGSHILCWVR